jgi:SagB-type dehydrogenase family enzyme
MQAGSFIDGGPVCIDEVYHGNSKHLPERLAFASRVQMARRERRNHAAFQAAEGRFKTYTGLRAIELPHDLVPLTTPLQVALQQRRSQRSFAGEPLSARELATVLAHGYGAVTPAGGGLRRPVPSGGGLYPLDVYLLQFAGGSVAEGVYHYHVGGHRLQCVSPQCARAAVAAASMYPDIVTGACAVLVVVADMRRTRCKYGERSYRLALLEAGHVSQNLYLIAAALQIGVVALDGFYDDRVHALLDLDGVAEIALLTFALGSLP